jgi:hypothetical protein
VSGYGEVVLTPGGASPAPTREIGAASVAGGELSKWCLQIFTSRHLAWGYTRGPSPRSEHGYVPLCAGLSECF